MKIDIIEYCEDCSKRYYFGNNLCCEVMNKIVDKYHPIPKDCPLDDYSENTTAKELLKICNDKTKEK